jgi:hypothetical protein
MDCQIDGSTGRSGIRQITEAGKRKYNLEYEKNSGAVI